MAKKTKTVTTKSPLPIYLGAGTFFLLSLILPMYKMSAILIGLALSLMVIFVLRKMNLFSDLVETVVYEEPEFFASKEIEDIVLEGRKMKQQMSVLNDKIKDEEVSASIDQIEKTHQAILDVIQKQPESVQSIRKYMKYYVPSILELLNHYNELEHSELTGENAETGRQKIKQLLETADKAFKKQLDSLMDSKMLDIAVESRVLEDLMRKEGLLEKK